jgi:hypothetical protein
LAPLLIALVTIPVLGESRLRVGLDPFLVLLTARALVPLGSGPGPTEELAPPEGAMAA